MIFDMIDKIQWMGYEWLTQERWGRVHPKFPFRWNDPSAIEIDDDGTLRLYARPNSRIFNIDGEDIESEVGFGLISCTTEFGWGTFEVEAKMPKGPYTWPAFWCWAFESWPPEIDMFEGYSNKRGSYFNWSLRSLIGKFWRVNSNIHLKGTEEDPRDQLGAESHWLGWISPDRKFNKYKLVWTPDEISIYFNERRVRHITDKTVLVQFENRTMNIILNNSVQNEYLTTDMPETEFIVKYFKYTPLVVE